MTSAHHHVSCQCIFCHLTQILATSSVTLLSVIMIRSSKTVSATFSKGPRCFCGYDHVPAARVFRRVHGIKFCGQHLHSGHTQQTPVQHEGIQLHLLCNEKGELINFVLTAPNVDDRNEAVIDTLTDRVFGNYTLTRDIYHVGSQDTCLQNSFSNSKSANLVAGSIEIKDSVKSGALLSDYKISDFQIILQ